MKKAFIIIGSIVAGIMVLSFALCTFGFLVSESEKPKDNKKVDTIDVKSTEAKKDYKKTENMFENKDFILKILKVNKNFKKQYMSIENKGYRVVSIDIEIENLKDDDIFTETFECKLDNGYTATQNFYSDKTLISEKVLSGTKYQGSIAFEVPPESKKITLIYDYGFWNNKKIEFNIDVGL
jgi:hypothetical protein